MNVEIKFSKILECYKNKTSVLIREGSLYESIDPKVTTKEIMRDEVFLINTLPYKTERDFVNELIGSLDYFISHTSKTKARAMANIVLIKAKEYINQQ